MEMLKGQLCWKGERGLSAYEIAKQNGYEGTEQDWLATLGTSSHFSETKKTYTINDISIKEFDLPNKFTTGMFLSVYLDGHRLTEEQYFLDIENSKILLNETLIIKPNSTLEIVESFLSTNNFPIMETINEDSTNENVPGTKAVYDFVKNYTPDLTELINDIKKEIINLEHPIGSIFFTSSTANPTTLYGGVWQLIAQGCAIVGVGTGVDQNGSSQIFNLRKNNGEYTHQLDINEMPYHNHNGLYDSTDGVVYNAPRYRSFNQGNNHSGVTDGAGNGVHTGYAGGNQAHNNIQPTYGLYIWERIS